MNGRQFETVLKDRHAFHWPVNQSGPGVRCLQCGNTIDHEIHYGARGDMKLKDRVNADIRACGDGAVRYEVVYDNHIYESGFRTDWQSAIARVGSIMHELAELLIAEKA